MITAFLFQTWVQRLGWTLLHFFWQGTAIAGIYALLRHLLPNSVSAKRRYDLACATLLAMALAPVLTFLLIPDEDIMPLTLLGARAFSWNLAEVGWQRLLNGFVVVWLLGVLGFSVRLAGGLCFTSRLRSATQPAPAEWQHHLNRIASRMGISCREITGRKGKASVRLLISSHVNVPTVIGWLRPAILVPAEFLTGLPLEQIMALNDARNGSHPAS